MKTLFILALGLGIGYAAGFKDAKKHDRTVVERTLDRVGGSNRGKYKADIDGAMERVERQ